MPLKLCLSYQNISYLCPMITESDMGCLKINFSSDTKLPAVSHHASTLLGNHASTRLSTGLGSGTWITYTDGEAIQHLHYLPYGEEQIDQRLTSFNSRYTFSAKEKDIETGYSYFGARYYNSDLSIWLSVDPMSDKYPNLSNYVYCSNNPIKLIDPNGEEEWELNTTTGNFTKVGDKGGTKADYYNIGTTNDKGEFVTAQTQSINRDGKHNINSFRISETEKSTISAFHIPDAKEGELSSGFFLEPKGPSTEKSGQNQRIPEGSYNVMKNDGTDFPGVPKLFNDNVAKERGILIHNGNYPKDTRGCLLIGSTKDKDFVGNSVTTLNKLNNYIKDKGYSNIRVNIFNAIKK